MEFIAMLVHTSVEKGFVYHLQFQNEASNGSFRLECNKSMFEGFFWVYWVPPSTLCIPCLLLLVCSLMFASPGYNKTVKCCGHSSLEPLMSLSGKNYKYLSCSSLVWGDASSGQEWLGWPSAHYSLSHYPKYPPGNIVRALMRLKASL